MTQYKITIHCGQTNAYIFEEHPTIQDAKAKYMGELHDLLEDPAYFEIGDILINPKHITFVQFQEVIEEPVKESEAQENLVEVI